MTPKKTYKLSPFLAACTLLLLFLLISTYYNGHSSTQESNKSARPIENVTIAILAKDKGYSLPAYLACIEKQTWPAEKTNLYIRTNNNKDNTVQILRDWVAKVGHRYAAVYFDDVDIETPVQNYGQHEWNEVRFKALGKIRQDSVNWSYNQNSHYFVVDCDNFIYENTLEELLKTQLPIVAPLMHTISRYSNFHAAVDGNGYYQESPFYNNILYQEIKGLINVPVVHCAYLIRHEFLDKIVYDDTSGRYEYIIFSDNARKKNIPQYLDNREIYGYITFAENEKELNKEPWFKIFRLRMKKGLKANPVTLQD